MPCCFAKLRHSQCRHIRLLKLGCTNRCGDDSLCPQNDQRLLLVAKYRWSCDDCLLLAFRAEDKAKQDKLRPADRLECRIRQVQLREDLDEEFRLVLIGSMLEREERFNGLVATQRLEQVKETQRVEQWVSHYGSALFELLFPSDSEEESEAIGDEESPWQPQQTEQDALDGEDNDTDDDMADLVEEDESSIPSVNERRTVEQLAMWLNLLLSTKNRDMTICQDAYRVYQKVGEDDSTNL
ncbi:hypothetical protein E4U21_007943, partial [Claviceps maximensis]